MHDWNRCSGGTTSRSIDFQGSNWSFHGTRGEKYHGDWLGEVNPAGSDFGSKSFNLRGTSWKYPSGGGKPSFP
jgi:hypothetical protein